MSPIEGNGCISMPPGVHPHGHFVQFYQADEPQLNRNIGRYLWEGLLRGDGLLVLATPQRRESIAGHLRRLGAEVEIAVRQRQLVMFDADETLAQLLRGGQPDFDLFQTTIGRMLQLLPPRETGAGVRAYGELVGVLWQAGQYDAAIQLEEHWNTLLESQRISLFCGYPIDIFSQDAAACKLDSVLGAHTHLVPTGGDGVLDLAVKQAIQDVVGGDVAIMADHTGGSRAQMPVAERTIFWLRQHFPDTVPAILARARDYYVEARSSSARPI